MKFTAFSGVPIEFVGGGFFYGITVEDEYITLHVPDSQICLYDDWKNEESPIKRTFYFAFGDMVHKFTGLRPVEVFMDLRVVDFKFDSHTTSWRRND